MDLNTYDAIIFPADGRPPHIVELKTSPITQTDPKSGQFFVASMQPHPEVHMTAIAEDNGQRPWTMQIVDSLEGMSKRFEFPFIIFYPIIPRTGSSFPINQTIRELQGTSLSEESAWRGDIVIAKYHDNEHTDPLMSFVDIDMSDFPLLKNYFATHGPSKEMRHGLGQNKQAKMKRERLF